jgi:hypothetical protein
MTAQTVDTTILPGAFARPPGATPEVRPEILGLVKPQVEALLQSSSGYGGLDAAQRQEMADNLTKIASYSAALIHDDWHQSQRIGQTPLVREQKTITATPVSNQLAQSQADDKPRTPADEFAPRAADNVARITEDTLNAIAFPKFVADLVKGTFQAIVDASIQQMEAFGQLLSNVAKTVDEFMADNISDNQARDWIAQSYPQMARVDTTGESPRVVPNGEGAIPDSARKTLGVPANVTSADDETLEQTLVPAARRYLAQSRQQVLATMVLMGINRIVVTSGRIRAKMGFRIDTTDRARAESASKFDMKHEHSIKYGWFLSPINAESRTSVAYVSSSKKDSESEINVEADLTGEVDLKFKSETFPLERFADAGVLSSIQGNTAVPSANKPITGNTAAESRPAAAGAGG